MIKCLIAIVKNNAHTIQDISKTADASYKKTVVAVKRLEDEALVERNRNQRSYEIQISQENIGKAFINLCYEAYSLDISSYLFGAKLEILKVLSIEDGFTAKDIGKILNKHPRTITQQLKPLRDRFIVYYRDRKFYLNRKIYDAVYLFAREYRLHTKLDVRLYWKFNDEMLFESFKEMPETSIQTGYLVFERWGVRYGGLKYFLFSPKKKLSKEEAFIHSLHQLQNPRDLAINITFYMKNKMKRDKLEFLSRYFGVNKKYHALLEMIDKGRLSPLLPKITKAELIEILGVYDVTQRLRWNDVRQNSD